MTQDNTVSLDDLRRILIAAAGEDESTDMEGEILDVSFEDLGYDSLALMEAAAQIKREFGVEIDDDDLVRMQTPREMLDTVARYRP
jgi:act minimal PKS acyl carrier protein